MSTDRGVSLYAAKLRAFCESVPTIGCTVDQESDEPDAYWFNFEPKSTTTFCASVQDERVVFATLHASFDDEPEFGEALDRVLEGVGLAAEAEF